MVRADRGRDQGVSNVPGPQMPPYFLRCRVRAMYPRGPMFHGTGLNITVTSLTAKLGIGIIACRQRVAIRVTMSPRPIC